MRRDVPEPWAAWMIEAALVSPNARRPIPSARRLAERIGVSTTTVMNMMYGVTDTDPGIVAAAAQALGQDVVQVSKLVGQARTVSRPWEPPAEAHLLSRRQQLALSELIRSVAEESGPRGNATPMNDPARPYEGDSPIELYLRLAGKGEELDEDKAELLAELQRRGLPERPEDIVAAVRGVRGQGVQVTPGRQEASSGPGVKLSQGETREASRGRRVDVPAGTDATVHHLHTEPPAPDVTKAAARRGRVEEEEPGTQG